MSDNDPLLATFALVAVLCQRAKRSLQQCLSLFCLLTVQRVRMQ